MRILVTGGCGFQGSHIVRKWKAKGHDITVLNTFSESAQRTAGSLGAGVTVIWGSVTDKEIVEKSVREQDAVLHLAARINVDESIQDPEAYLQTNVMGTFNVLEAVRHTGARLVFGSSCEVYGSSGDGAPAKEASELLPHSPYAASKAAADRLCIAYHKTWGVNVTVVRPCNIYGEGQKSGKGGAVIPIFVDRALRGEALVVFGDGTQSREYMNVDDLVGAYDFVLESDRLRGETINVGTGERVAIKTIAETVASRLGAKVTHGDARPGEVSGFWLDSGKAHALGFTAKVRFAEGIARYIEWRKANPGH